MATHEIFMPALSSTMTEGKIVEWLKQPGDKVDRGESVLVVESDKADMDVEAFQEGYLASILMPSGSSAPVGETIGLIVESKEEIQAVQEKTPDTPLIEKSDKPLPAPKPPSVTQESKETVPAPVKTKTSPLPSTTTPSKNVVVNDGRIVASPKAKKLASQMGVDLTYVQGSGPHGRIQADDVLKAKGEPITVPWVAESDAPASLPNPPSSLEVAARPSKDTAKNEVKSVSVNTGNSFGSLGETVPFNTLQQAVNRNMEASLAVPCFRVGYTIITDKFEAFYKEVKPRGVTMTALLAKAVGLILARHPQVNSACSPEGMSYPTEINVAVAVSMEDGGLITPVLRNADKTNLIELSQRWSDLVKRSRNKQLQPDEYSSGTFTLSNLGMFGVDRFDAILPPGTGAILAVAASLPNVVAAKDGSISVKRQMQVNLTADHRVIYGADGASFLKDLANLIETNPESLLS
tara:strand:- start:6557 stop:7948 length:1392 start_codon:yes stop_codon:yes gene_type:complete